MALKTTDFFETLNYLTLEEYWDIEMLLQQRERVEKEPPDKSEQFIRLIDNLIFSELESRAILRTS